MTGPFYSVGPIKNVLLQASNITTFITELRDVLLSCNWDLVSSFVGFLGSPGYILSSYKTPVNNNKIRLKIFYDGDAFGAAYALVKVMISDETGANEQLAGFIMIENDLGDKTLRCICGPHQFFIFIDGSISPNQLYINRFHKYNNLMGGCPKVAKTTHSQVFWALGDAGNNETFRDRITGGGTDPYAFLINEITPWLVPFPDGLGNTGNCVPLLLTQRGSDLEKQIPHSDGNWPIIEPILVMGRFPSKYYGVYLWDAIVVGTRFETKIDTIIDNRHWENLTLTTNGAVPGSLFLVTSPLITPTIGSYSH